MTFYCQNMGYIVNLIKYYWPILNSVFIYQQSDTFVLYWYNNAMMLKWESLVRMGRFLGYMTFIMLKWESLVRMGCSLGHMTFRWHCNVKKKMFKSVPKEVLHSILSLLFQSLKGNAGLRWKHSISIGCNYWQPSFFLPLDDLEILILTIPMKSYYSN